MAIKPDIAQATAIGELPTGTHFATPKAGSHRSRQRYRSVAVTSNVKVFTQKSLAVTEVIFLISSVLR